MTHDVENQITREDALAVATVSAPMPAAVASQLRSEPVSGLLPAWLRQLPTDIDLWEGEDNEVRYRVCSAMREAGVGYISVLRGLGDGALPEVVGWVVVLMGVSVPGWAHSCRRELSGWPWVCRQGARADSAGLDGRVLSTG